MVRRVIALVVIALWIAGCGEGSTASSSPAAPERGSHLGERQMIDCLRSPDDPPSDADFAFAGTVTAIVPSAEPTEEDDTPHGQWTFAVDEWFTEAGPEEVTVALMWGLEVVDSSDGGEYRLGVGDRLLISGMRDEPASGDQPSSGLTARPCGYSRTYDEATASTWRQVFDSEGA